ncbi:MAG: conserved exported protein of unknown function [Candidatus Thorarchaeota archaeon]|nr:MAG: conserved exported protein of unknown function [Candidatus Thorarchaeota archaeon]
MKKGMLSSITLVIIIGCSIVPLISAQTNHTLEWGIEEGETFTYVLQRKFVANPNQLEFVEAEIPFIRGFEEGQKATALVEELEEVPEEVISSSDVPVAKITLKRQNDSATIINNWTAAAVPINDWEKLEDLGGFLDVEGVTIVDSEDEWGTISQGTYVSGSTNIGYYFEFRFEKENGTLSYMRIRYTSLGNDLIDVILAHWYEGMPTVVTGDIPLTTILGVSLGLVVAAIVGFMVYRSYKSKRSPIEELGRK